MALRIEYLEETEDVYDITVEDTENFYANGILIHNCVEITLPTTPLTWPDGGDIALCTLSAINWGKIRSPEDFEEPCRLAVIALNGLLDYQEYPLEAAENSTLDRRPIGIGIINFAYWLAKNDLTYQDITPEGLAKIHQYAEAWSYYLIRASVDLAMATGKCPLSNETKYNAGLMPIDTYKKDVDLLVAPEYKMDWDTLRADAKLFGIKNSTLMALMPAECQSLYNDIQLESGLSQTLGEIIEEYANLDIGSVHQTVFPGQRFEFIRPLKLADGSTAHECYYNGVADVTEVQFEDGSSYKFTNNHKLLVIRNNKEIWVTIDQLREDDDVKTTTLAAKMQ